MNKERRKFRFCIVGSSRLLKKCCDIILHRGHEILCVVTDDKKSMMYDDNDKLYCIDINNIKKFKGEYDILLSIVNNKIISKELLRTPKKLSINYHNSPLPKYAGMNATSWAIFNNEKKHAITWHVMEEKIDVGAILKQVFFSISENETSLSLNLKCFYNAVKSFDLLLDDLENNTLSYKKQNLQNRSYFSSKHFFPKFGFIDFNSTAEDIDKLIRILTFGTYNNELGFAKMIVDDKILVPISYEITNKKSKNIAGTIVRANSKEIEVSTNSYNILFYDFCDLFGTVIKMEQAEQMIKKSNILQLYSVSENELEYIKTPMRSQNVIKKQLYQAIKNFTQLEEIPFASYKKLQNQLDIQKIKISNVNLNKLLNSYAIEKDRIFALYLAIIVLWLYKATLNNRISILLKRSKQKFLKDYWLNIIPICITISDISFYEFFLQIEQELKTTYLVPKEFIASYDIEVRNKYKEIQNYQAVYIDDENIVAGDGDDKFNILVNNITKNPSVNITDHITI